MSESDLGAPAPAPDDEAPQPAAAEPADDAARPPPAAEDPFGFADILQHAREDGPVDTVYRLARSELGGPFVREAFARLNPVLPRGVTGPWGVWFYIVCLGPLLAATFLFGTDLLLTTGIVWLEVLGVAALVAGGAAAAFVLYVLAIRRTRERWAKPVRGWSKKDLAWWGSVTFLAPTVAFAAFAALIVHQHIVPVSGVKTNAPNLAFATFETFTWNLADTIPLLMIPETLHWNARLQFTTTGGGALVLFYKLIFIYPLAQLAALATKSLFGE